LIKKKVLFWGGRSKARIIVEMIMEIYSDQIEIIGIFDNTLNELSFNSKIKLYNKKSDLNTLCERATHFVVCIGGENGFARFKTAEKLKDRGLLPLNIISNYAILDQIDKIGDGIQVMPGAVANKFSKIGDQCILNTNSTLDHECIIGDGVHIMGGASIAGRVKIGNFSIIGTNATILPDLVIGENVYIGAGAVVTKNIIDNVVVVGAPAKTIKKFRPTLDLSIFDN
jgi:sugar O-acyltransferase (sialic acid O-acetyltransferase NeuD family)